MLTTQEYINMIQQKSQDDLNGFWEDILSHNTIGWAEGKAFEFLILRAFELEGASVRWPYSVTLYDNVIEQIDGVIHFYDINLSVLAEFKDQKQNQNIEAIAKLRNQLQRRPSNIIGSVFSTSSFTDPAILLSHFLAPQTILLWEQNEIEYCLKHKSFKQGLVEKYKHAIEEGVPNFDITVNLA